MPLNFLPLKRKFLGNYNLDYGAGAIVVTSVVRILNLTCYLVASAILSHANCPLNTFHYRANSS